MNILKCFATIKRVWLFLFLYSATVALLVQCFLLPYVFTAFHAGEGLLAGGDWVGFHQIALELAERIRVEGWSAWELRPQRQAPSGIAAALYVLTVPHPWVLIPLNAAIHATTGVVLIRVIQSFLPSVAHALICVAPFIFFPSALSWYAQIHKDGYYILGMSLCLYGWIILARPNILENGLKVMTRGLLTIVTGCLLVAIVRPYGIKLIQGAAVIFAGIILPVYVARLLHHRQQAPQILARAAIIALLPALTLVFPEKGADGEMEVIAPPSLLYPQNSINKSDGNKKSELAVKASHFAQESKWKDTPWLPSQIDQRFFTLAIVRAGYANSVGASNIDTEIIFHSASDFFPYLPRALQIGFTAPFPTHWFSNGAGETGTMMRRITAAEMIVVYVGLLLLPLALWRWRNKTETWLVLTFCTFLLLTYTYITPNIGSLYRSRYGFLMTLVAVGFAGGVASFIETSESRRRRAFELRTP